jgi:fructosamine-3-kinase
MNPFKVGQFTIEVAEAALPRIEAAVEAGTVKKLFEASSSSGTILREIGATAAPDIEKIARQAGLGVVTAAEKLPGGVVNNVYRVHTSGDPFIARFNLDSLSVFHKEQWAMNLAAQKGVRVPKVFSVGEDGNISYMLMEDLGGKTLSALRGDRGEALEDLGQQVNLINKIRVKGFGFHLDQRSARPFFTEAWRPMKEGENSYIFEGDPLVRLGALTTGEQAQAKLFLEPMLDWRFPPRLCHGDVSLGNAILQDNGKVAIIDWTQTKGGAAPFFDLANLSMNIPREFSSVLKGYGITPARFASQLPNFNRVALTDVLRAGSWAQRTGHPEPAKFVADIRSIYEKIFR